MDESYSQTDKVREALDAYLDEVGDHIDTQDLAENIIRALGLELG